MSRLKLPILICLAAFLTACTPFTPSGWTAQKRCGSQGNCWFVGSTPDNGHWLGFYIGMSRDTAIAAACESTKKKEAEIEGFSVHGDGHCLVDSRRAAQSLWSANAGGFWCLPWSAANVFLDFDEKNGRVTRIAAYCANTFDP